MGPGMSSFPTSPRLFKGHTVLTDVATGAMHIIIALHGEVDAHE